MLNPRTNRRPMTRPARFRSLGALVPAAVVVAGLQSGPAAAQDTMFRVDYVKTRTVGATEVEREEGTHTFAPTGHRRMDRVVDGERTTTEIPPWASGSRTCGMRSGDERGPAARPVRTGRRGLNAPSRPPRR